MVTWRTMMESMVRAVGTLSLSTGLMRIGLCCGEALPSGITANPSMSVRTCSRGSEATWSPTFFPAGMSPLRWSSSVYLLSWSKGA